MKRYYDEGGVTIYHGDCRELLPVLEPSDFAALVTDPPYGMAYKSNGGGTTRPAATRAVLIYDKGGATGMGDLSIPWKPSHEEIYVLGRGFVGSRDCGSVLQGRVQAMARNGREHPTEKDPRTLQALIQKCPPGVILDPFMGVGTTLRAAKNLGRRAVGIELDERYCEAAVRRLGQEVLDLEDAA